jgi:hypothetical protein
MRKAVCFSVFLAVLSAAAAGAQELVYDQPMQVSYDFLQDNSFYAIPAIVFNGTDHGVFFNWKGKNDYEQGVHFRRLDADAKPIGPQKKLYGFPLRYNRFITAVWDGEAYVAAFYEHQGKTLTLHLLRVSRTGVVLKHKTAAQYGAGLWGGMFGPPYLWSNSMFTLGDQVFLFFDYYDAGSICKVNLLRIDHNLDGDPVINELPTGDFKYPCLIGAALDTDKFLVLIGELNRYAIATSQVLADACLLHVDLGGEVIKQPFAAPAVSNIMSEGVLPADKALMAPAYEVGTPVYVGDGYVMAVSNYVWDNPNTTANMAYINNSFRMDDEGNLLNGPFNLGGGPYGMSGLESGRLAGNHVAYPAKYYFGRDDFMILLGRKGGHIGNVDYVSFWLYYESPYLSDHAYTGTANTILINAYKKNVNDGPSAALNGLVTAAYFSNQYTMPPFTKPGFFYFKAGTAEPVKDHRLVMWSVVGGRNVTLTGPDFELEDLPPVWHYLVDTKGQKTKLTLSFTTPDGKTLTRKLRIKP